MGKLGDMTWTGKSGKKYAFGVFTWGTAFKEDYAAVYLVTRRYKKADGKYNHDSIYVGETDDLSSRFDDHHKQRCFDEHKKNCVCAHGESDEEKRLAIERDLLGNYNWPCNG